jgi:hypothetical protein
MNARWVLTRVALHDTLRSLFSNDTFPPASAPCASPTCEARRWLRKSLVSREFERHLCRCHPVPDGPPGGGGMSLETVPGKADLSKGR